MKMKNWKFPVEKLAVVIAGIIFLSCNGLNNFVDQFFVDYFPLEENMRWIYRTEDGTEIIREVLQISQITPTVNRIQLESMGELEYYIKGPDFISLEFEKKDYIYGNEILFEKTNLLLFYQPVVKPQSNSDTLRRIIVVGSDTISYVRVFSSSLSFISGMRKDLSIFIESKIECSKVMEVYNLYYHLILAPDTGAVYLLKVENGDSLELILSSFVK